MAIPRKLFQTTRRFDDLPQDIKDNINKLRKLNPDWVYKLYEDVEMKDFIQQHVSSDDWSELLRLNPRYSVVLADLFRYLLIYKEGGVYLDIKSTATRPLSDVMPPKTSFVLSQWRNRLGEPFVGSGFYPELEGVPGGEFQQWHIIAEAGHPFLKAAIDRTLHNIRNYSTVEMGVSSIGVFRVSGPICYTQAIWPLHSHPRTLITDIEKLGFRYSIYQDDGDTYKYAKLNPNHYSKSTEPLFWRDRGFVSFRLPRGNLSELLAQELRDNTELVLKIAVFSLISTVIFAIAIPLIAWLLIRLG